MSHKDAAPVRAFIDSIVEGVARVITRRDGQLENFTVPAALLPQGAGEGAWIELSIRVIPTPAEEDPAALRKALLRGDDGGDLVL